MTEHKVKAVGVPSEFYDDLKTIAKANHRSMSGQVAFWISQSKVEELEDLDFTVEFPTETYHEKAKHILWEYVSEKDISEITKRLEEIEK